MAFLVNAPNAPGVPPVLYAPGSGVAGGVLLTSDSYTYFGGLFGPQWGIFLDGFPVVVADTVVAFDYRQEWVISDYPIEEGSFESYDKVAVPFEGRVRFAAGGSADNRAALLASIDAIAGDLNFYDLATPEQTYSSVSVRHYDYRRTAEQGTGMLVVDVWCEQVISSATSFGSTAAASGASPSNGGTVQGGTPTAGQAGAVG